VPEVPINIPRAGQASVEGTVAQWLVADGAHVAEGAPLYVLETDKVEMEVPSPATGTLSITARTGEALPVGTEIARITTA
jgi:pyruvate/2-oxoglutarate dehydrogenase complex dihydrolipoamide acyltransferase (E2) component